MCSSLKSSLIWRLNIMILCVISMFMIVLDYATLWLHVNGEPSNWQITQAIRYYTSACLKALKYWWFSAFFFMCKTPIPCAQNNNTTLLITFYSISCVSVN